MSAPNGPAALPDAAELARLPRDGGEQWNRLVFEKSPYLLQHAANPVDWWPWGDAAFEEARRRDVPVFLSIGYATCHWCHVMERESFEDAEAAALLNASFVCVKVDREERPDVDHVYMSVTQAMTGQGGWPMTCALTPDRRAFFAGTYFPKHGRQGRPGVMQLAPALADAWASRREDVLESADRVGEALTQLTAGAPGGPLSETILSRAAEQLALRFDAQRGGFGHAPKFPTAHVLSLLARWGRRSGDARALSMVEHTLDAMRAGGIWDHVGFGFHRYSTDPDWLVPHFEKMLYDQALAVLAYLDAFQATGEARHADTARKTLEYVRRDLTSPEGAFLSAEDADSEGQEGLFYLWTPAEVKAVLDGEDAELWCRAFDVREGGNFRDEASGRPSEACIPHLPCPLPDLARDLALPEEELAARLERSRTALLAARAKRARPALDDKVLTDWNGLMIAAVARAAAVLDDAPLAEAAVAAADFVLVHLRRPDGRLWIGYRMGSGLVWGVYARHTSRTSSPKSAALARSGTNCISGRPRAKLAGSGDGYPYPFAIIVPMIAPAEAVTESRSSPRISTSTLLPRPPPPNSEVCVKKANTPGIRCPALVIMYSSGLTFVASLEVAPMKAAPPKDTKKKFSIGGGVTDRMLSRFLPMGISTAGNWAACSDPSSASHAGLMPSFGMRGSPSSTMRAMRLNSSTEYPGGV